MGGAGGRGKIVLTFKVQLKHNYHETSTVVGKMNDGSSLSCLKKWKERIVWIR